MVSIKRCVSKFYTITSGGGWVPSHWCSCNKATSGEQAQLCLSKI